jgi:hypothetical protein
VAAAVSSRKAIGVEVGTVGVCFQLVANGATKKIWDRGSAVATAKAAPGRIAANQLARSAVRVAAARRVMAA